jgi:hypothetical protein
VRCERFTGDDRWVARGARGWGEAFVTVYPDSDKIGAAPGVTFRRADAIDARLNDAGGTSTAMPERCALGSRRRTVNLTSATLGSPADPEWCREKWALVVSGAPTLPHADGQTTLSPDDICCFPQGPTGAHRLSNDGTDPARLISSANRAADSGS